MQVPAVFECDIVLTNILPRPGQYSPRTGSTSQLKQLDEQYSQELYAERLGTGYERRGRWVKFERELAVKPAVRRHA
jgi:hypothetical protein